jgi:signal transduction histidine kinase
MRERVELLGGVIHFASQPARLRADCGGTKIEAQLPIQDSEIT